KIRNLLVPVRDLAAIERHVDAGFDLACQIGDRGGDDEIIAGVPGQQLGFDHRVAVIDVIVDADTGLLLEVRDGVFGDVVGPVVDVQRLLRRYYLAPGSQCHGSHPCPQSQSSRRPAAGNLVPLDHYRSRSAFLVQACRDALDPGSGYRYPAARILTFHCTRTQVFNAVFAAGIQRRASSTRIRRSRAWYAGSSASPTSSRMTL